jgi:hypothetical protein
MAPSAPGVRLMTALGLPFQMLWPQGREPTSKAFLRAPGMPRLYSGVMISTASELAMAVRNAVQAGGGVAVSRSWL